MKGGGAFICQERWSLPETKLLVLKFKKMNKRSQEHSIFIQSHLSRASTEGGWYRVESPQESQGWERLGTDVEDQLL